MNELEKAMIYTENKLDKTSRENIYLRGILIILITILIGLPLWYLHTLIIEPFAILVKAIAETVLIAGFGGTIYEIFIRMRFKDQMASAVAKAINADVKFMKEKLKGEVDLIIRNALEAKLCNEGSAIALYEGLGIPYFDNELFRDNFYYEIWLNKMKENEIKINNSEIAFGKGAYFRMREEMRYRKRLHLEKGRKLILGLCFEEKQLDSYMLKECIYRTIMRIGEDERDKLKEILKESPGKIFENDAFKIAVKVDDTLLGYPEIQSYNASKGIEILYEYNGPIKDEAKFEIEIESIRNKKINYYTAYLYDPTKSPTVKLNYCEEIEDVYPVTYFTCKSKGSRKKIRPDPVDASANYRSVEIDEWVFPTSGVVFVWKICV